MIRQDFYVLLCGRVVANVVGDLDTAPPRSRHIADGWRCVYNAKGLRLQMKRRVRGPALTKAELRARGKEAMAAATKPVVKLPTKLVRQCGRCGEFSSVMVEPGEEAPPFKCKVCDKPARDA
jgi:hypothetical protein